MHLTLYITLMGYSMGDKIAHLGFIQGVINRMGNNSFLVKGWTVALVAAILALSSNSINANFVAVALFPVFVFWALDAYYLRQERLFRKLYESVSNGIVNSSTFTMDVSIVNGDVACLTRIAFSISVFPFYMLILVLIFALAVRSGVQIDFGAIKLLCQKSA